MVEKISKLVPLDRNTQVLDFGAGTGLVTFQFLPKVGLVYLLDPSREMLGQFKRDVMKTDFHNFEICAGTLDEFTLPPMDIAVCSLSLHHTPDIARSIQQLFDCLRPGGRFFAVEKKHIGDWISQRLVEAGFRDVAVEDQDDRSDEEKEEYPDCVNIFVSATRPSG
jgi:ubiquinone/menaquinone biosynthesis C-methylase UbiE